MTTLVFTTWLVILMTKPITGLQVSPGSPCTAYCLDDRESDPFSSNSSHTSTSEIVCQDKHFSSTVEGKKLKDCMGCLKDSEFVNGTESDLDWLLYNMRFATDTCLFKSPENVDLELQLNSTCAASSTCGPLKDALGTGKSNEEEKESNRYAFCSASQDGFGKDILPCLTCLEDESESTYLSNFINVLSAACVYKPATGAIFITGDLFSKDGFEITASKKPDSSSEGKSEDSPKKKEGLSTAQIVGIVAGISVAFIIAAVLFVIHFLRQKTLAQKKLAEYHAYHRQYEKMVDSASLSTLQQAPTLEANNAHATFPFAVDHTDHAVPKMYTLRAPSPDLGTNSEHSAEVPAHPAYHPGLRSREDLRLRQENPTPPEPVPDSEVAGMVNLPIFLDTPQRQQFGHMSPQSIVSGRGQQMSPQSIVSDRGQQMSPQSIISGRGQYMSPQSINATADQFSPQSFRSLPMRDPTPMTSPSGQSMSFMSRQLSPLGSIKSGIAMGSISHGMSVPTSSKRMDRKKSSKHRRAAPSKLEISAPVHMTEPRFQDVPLNGAPQVSKTPKHSRFWALMSPQQPPQSATSAIW